MVDSNVEIPTRFDPFAEAEEFSTRRAKEYVHIRIQQRNGKKSLTTIQGLRLEGLRKEYLSFEKILKNLKKDLCCNGNVVQDKELGKVIQLQGDQRKNVSQFLVNAGIVKKDQIKIHGF
ncbi:protein translation factor SUI1 homolog [Lycium ferocissimum]|uniref:protein translation factor SUI1 homolog n=1 Tax=Lycium ferocissimum TaxID=112874 RepID=UPI0028168526|nr:protein translation factor SUI1 homolog [Lycium ferocissimum]